VNLRNRLLAIFLAATLAPLGALFWITVLLLEHSLNYTSTDQLDRLSSLLKETARELYQNTREDLRSDAAAGRVTAQHYPLAANNSWPPAVRDFWGSGETERFSLSGKEGNQLDYLVRSDSEVRIYSRHLGNIRMEPLSTQYSHTRGEIEEMRNRDLRQGFLYTLILLSTIIWLVSCGTLAFLANRISRPIQELTAGLSRLSRGDYQTRVAVRRRDEIGLAIDAFNGMADQLQRSRERLVYLTQVASWQLLARKMAHELKNSLTPIRLTVEEIVARQPPSEFLTQAAQVVREEIETLQYRVRAFSEFSGEPVPSPVAFDTHDLVRERIDFLSVAHPVLQYELALAPTRPVAFADPDLVKGILTNLLENAAEAMKETGRILVLVREEQGKVYLEVHDSGPGLNEDARRSLFEPTISFKEHGMGLGLSISRKNALIAGGDLVSIESRLGGAAFRLLLPVPPGR